MKVTRELMARYLQEIGFDLFEFPDGWAGKLEPQFNEWASKQEDWFFKDQAGNAAMTERLMKDEEAGEQIADFMDGLSPGDYEVALEGMIGLLRRAELADSELGKTLLAMK